MKKLTLSVFNVQFVLRGFTEQVLMEQMSIRDIIEFGFSAFDYPEGARSLVNAMDIAIALEVKDACDLAGTDWNALTDAELDDMIRPLMGVKLDVMLDNIEADAFLTMLSLLHAKCHSSDNNCQTDNFFMLDILFAYHFGNTAQAN